MGNLTLTRRQGETIQLQVAEDVDPQEALRWLMEEGIEITVTELHAGKVRLSIRAPDELDIWRGELGE